MLADTVRTSAFHEAILRTVEAGDVVLDIGTGTGILAMAAARAGARRVYAIEQGPVIDLARRVVTANGLADRVTFIEDLSTEVELPEPADVLVTETIGNAGFDEGILTWVADACERLLVPEPRLIPRSLRLDVALVDIRRDFVEFDRWQDPLLGFDFSALRTVALNSIQAADLTELSMVSDPVRAFQVDLAQRTTSLAARISLTARRSGTVHALGLWFTADLGSGLVVSSRPLSDVPSWQQAVLPLGRPLQLDQGDVLPIVLEIGRGGAEWSWQAGTMSPSSTVYGRLRGNSV
jgi:protein arginine N-methyltransferase 1